MLPPLKGTCCFRGICLTLASRFVAVRARTIPHKSSPFARLSPALKPLQVFNEDITGPEGSAIEVYTAVNGSFDEPFGNFTLHYGENDTTWPLPFDATADEVEEALEVREISPFTSTASSEMWSEHTACPVAAERCVLTWVCPGLSIYINVRRRKHG